MNTSLPIPDSMADTGLTAPGITIIYEDRVCGLRAKRFSDMLADALGGEAAGKVCCWRSELLDLPGIAEQMTRDAEGGEFVILSLRGDTGLSVAMKWWIESWLTGAAGGPSSLVALIDADRSKTPHAESVRHYLRHVATSAGVAFFSHCMVALTGEENESFPEESESVAGPQAHGDCRDGIASLFPTAVAA